MSNRKAVSAKDGSNTDLIEQLTMQNHNPNQPKFQPVSTSARRSLLDSTKLSRLPERRKPFPPKASAVCVGCGGRLDLFDTAQIRFSACRKCLRIYANIEAAFDEKTNCEKRERLEKFAAEVNR